MNKKYRLFDCLDLTVVGYADILSECNSLSRKIYIDTDGECDIVIDRWNGQRYEYYCDPEFSDPFADN